MPTVDHDIDRDKEVFAGEDKDLRFPIVNDDGSPTNISGWTFAFQVRLTRYTPDPPALELAGSIQGAGADGIAKVLVAEADTRDMKAGTYYYGLARTNAGQFDVVAEGKFVLRKAAVRAAP